MMQKNYTIRNNLITDGANYLVHNYHPYAAKFIPKLPRTLIKKFTNQHDMVMDPFCGSGTSIVESLLLNRKGIGVEINPIGALISKVKTTPLNREQILTAIQFSKKIESIRKTIFIGSHDTHGSKLSIPDLTNTIYFTNKFHWFRKDVLNAILYIKYNINTIGDKDVRDFLFVALSSLIVKVSNQESETRYAAVNKNIKPLDVFLLFEEKVRDMAKRMEHFTYLVPKEVYANIYQKDSRFINFIPENSVDFIVTSPPYPNTYDYYLYHKLRMIILGFDYKTAQENEIGSRHKHSSKKEDIDTYLQSMKQSFANFAYVLKPKHYFAVVEGDSIIRGIKYNGYEIIKDIASSTGFEVVRHISYDLDNITRLFNKSFRTKGKKEHIIILKNLKR